MRPLQRLLCPLTSPLSIRSPKRCVRQQGVFLRLLAVPPLRRLVLSAVLRLLAVPLLRAVPLRARWKRC